MRRLYAPGSDSSQTCAHIRTAEDIFHRLPKFSYERMPEIRAGGKKKARENTGGAGNRLFCPLNYGARYFAALIFFSASQESCEDCVRLQKSRRKAG